MDEMDAASEAVLKRFPEATAKVGNQPLTPMTIGATKIFELTCSAFDWQIDAKSPPVHAVGFNGTVPGPVLRVTEGDTVRVIVHNGSTSRPASISTGSPCPMRWTAFHS
jgi:hypothetical protein